MSSNIEVYEKWMRHAIVEAIKGLEDGEVPVGAVIVNHNKIIGRGYNQVESLNDATAHAEMIAITSASSTAQDWRLSDSFLFVTKEPCPMCAGAILNSRLKGIIYGFHDNEWGSCGSYYDICRDKRNKNFPIIKGGVLDKDCRELIELFFRNRRNKKV